MVLDEPRQTDQVFREQSFLFIIDAFTARHVMGPLRLDFDPLSGFRLASRNETLCYGLTMATERVDRNT